MTIKDFGYYCCNSYSLYDWDLSNSYIPIETEYMLNPFDEYKVNKWKTCPACQAKPKIWEFDNGRLAACKCYSKYEKKVEATPIGKYIRANNGSAEGFPHMELRDNWNTRCELLKKFINRGDTLKKLIKKL